MSKAVRIQSLESLAQRYLEQKDYQLAQQYAWQQLDIDNLYEPAVRQLMVALTKSGQRSAAMAQYEIYRRHLENALGAGPAAEMAELYRRIQADELQQTILRRPSPPIPATTPVHPIFCYTDIEGSTRLWDEHREAMLTALLQHNDLCETEIAKFDGRILHPTGDGFLIVFEQNDPLLFAISLQHQFARADWGEIGELRIRIGLHGATAGQEGHDFFREGSWYRGSVLNHAARIADTGHGGQIVASEMVKAYCALPAGASWQDLGEHNLKSLDEQQRIYGLIHPDLKRTDFPPLRTPANKQAAARADGQIRGYQLGQKIGQGAFGVVYRAHQPGIERDVAIKIIRPLYANRPDFIRRFEAEAQVIARLEHPHVVPLYDFWREADGAYLVMRYMRGGSVKSLLETGELDLPLILSLVDQVGAALTFAHRHGFVHRDIKPANILLDEERNAYLSDFGIVKNLGGEGVHTETGAVLGSPAYLSPEQALSQAVTPLSDQYSLAVTLYEMLTNGRPFADTSPSSLIIKQVNEPLPLVRASRPTIPAAVDECIQRATAKDPQARFPDIPALVRALHAAVQQDGSFYPLTADLILSDQQLINPYQGLRPFQEADAERFFGRKALIEQLSARFTAASAPSSTDDQLFVTQPGAAGRFLAVVGPSGSGKSSLVKAGLIPALREGGVPGSESWFIVEMVPGTHPLEELEAALLRIAVNPPASLIRQLEEDERGLVRAVKRVLPPGDSELLLLVDQFEELYTLVDSDERRAHFIASLLTALNEHNSRLRVVITLRADFYDRPLLTPGLADLMQQRMEIVPPMTREELEDVIVQPAVQAGAMFEAGLVPEIVDDVGEQPGSLPLLQYALTELFERRQERLLTRAAYADTGGVLGALARRAEELYAQLDEEGEGTARQLFLRLVTLGEGIEDTRRRVLRSELMGLGSTVVTETVIDAYGRYRLLTFDHDPLTRQPTIEVAHEALLREWQRLSGWLDESRDDVRLQRSLSGFAAEWSENKEDEGFLLRGSRLDLFAAWAAETRLALTAEEHNYLQASEDAREQRERAEQARQQRELETAQALAREQTERAEEQGRSARRLRVLVAGLAIVLLLAVGAAWLAVNQGQAAQANADLAATREGEALAEAEQRATAQALTEIERMRADEARLTAEEQAQIAFSRELAASALNQLSVDPERSIILALNALSHAHTLEAENALHQSIQSSRVQLTLRGHAGPVYFVAFSPDGEIVATTSGDGTAKVWNSSTGQELLTLRGHSSDIWGISFSPDGKRLATGSYDRTIIIWDALSGERLITLTGHESEVMAVQFSPDGQHLVSNGLYDGRVKVWDAETGEELDSFLAHQAPMWYVTYDPQGKRLATASVDGTAKVWDANSDEELLTFGGHAGAVSRVNFSPDGQRLVTSSFDVKIWDAETGIERLELDGHSSLVLWADFSPDGNRLATASADGKAKVWDAVSGEELFTLSGHSNIVLGLDFSPDGSRLATGSYDGSARIWNLLPERELLTMTDHDDMVYSIAFNPEGTRLISGSYDGRARVWDIADPAAGNFGQQILSVGKADATKGMRAVAFSPDGTRFIATNAAGLATVHDAETGQVILALEGHAPGQGGETDFDGITGAAFSPDGALIATASDDLTAKVWDASSGSELFTLEGHVSASANVPPFEGVVDLAFNPSGKLLATAGADGTVRIWSTEDGHEVLSLLSHPDSAVIDLAFNPDGSRLVTGGFDGTTKVWRVSIAGESVALEELFAFIGHTSYVFGVDFTPDGSRLVTVSDDGMAKVWDANSGQELITLTTQPQGLLDVAITPDGKYLATAGRDGAVRLFVLDTNELISLAQSRVTRSLSEEECQRYLHLDSCP